jgi:molybdate transport system substrate-binding protein
LLVAAAADLSQMGNDLAVLAGRNGVTIRLAYGSSGQLAQQIEQGAPYDVYVSANLQYARDLESQGKLVPGSVVEYARGRLALWSPHGRFRQLSDLAVPSVSHVAIANPAHAPYGVAARQALEKAGLWASLADRLVLGENVRQAFQFVSTGNADAGLVALSLVKDKGGILVDGSLHEPVVQAGGVVAGSRQPELGGRFLALLVGKEGQELLARSGFEPVVAVERRGGQEQGSKAKRQARRGR